jgi:hypothetical protein
MALYATHNLLGGTQQNLSSSFKSITIIKAATATLRRGYVFEIAVGADGAPNATDCAIVWDLSRQTADGTATAVTPNPLDPADTAAGTVSVANATAEGTITANSAVFDLAANQRASYRWVVNPGGPGELVIPATNLAGFALRAKSTTYASTVVGQLNFRE